MVVRDANGRLSVIECREDWTTDRRTGVMKTTLDDWVPAAYQAGYEVVWLPLERAGLKYINSNVDRLDTWFETVEGASYSPVKDFLASFDHPTQGLPAPFNTESLPMYLRMWHKWGRRFVFKQFWDEFVEAIGFRFLDHIEKDEWRYAAHQEAEAFTPASFVAQALQQLKVLDRYKINASEFTVKDIYELNIFDTRFEKPDQCMEADHQLWYCQMFGKYRVHLPGYSTIDPYDGMNETCPNKFENGWRPAGC